MIAMSLLSPILEDEHLTRGLGDPEARLLVEWVVEQAEQTAEAEGQADAILHIQGLCRRARAIGRFVLLWCHHHDHGGACQLAASERFDWPLPSCEIDPYDLTAEILDWEERRRPRCAA